MELIGQLKLKYDEQIVSTKFKKRDFVLATDLGTPYPNFILIQLTQDKCNILDSYNIGDELKVQINISGKEWNGAQGIRYFNTISAWRIEKTGKIPNAVNEGMNSQSNNSMNNSHQAPVFNSSDDDNENLPF
jgi:hypothetical protein